MGNPKFKFPLHRGPPQYFQCDTLAKALVQTLTLNLILKYGGNNNV
jgi:hypothetical protein